MRVRAFLPVLLVAGVSLVGSTAQAQSGDCAVWSRAENRCLQAATVAPSAADAVTSPTNAELRAKVGVLEQALARLQKDYAVLQAGCPAERLERATESLQTAQINADNQSAARLQQERLEDGAWYVQDVAFEVTETNKVFQRYGWKVTVKNGIPRAQTFDLVVQFLNARGLVVDTEHLYSQHIAALDARTMTGESLIRVPGSFLVTSVHVVATRKVEK